MLMVLRRALALTKQAFILAAIVGLTDMLFMHFEEADRTALLAVLALFLTDVGCVAAVGDIRTVVVGLAALIFAVLVEGAFLVAFVVGQLA